MLIVLPAAFLNMLCSLRWGIYIFFAFWQFVAIVFVYFLVPETRGVPIEEVSSSAPASLLAAALLTPTSAHACMHVTAVYALHTCCW